MRDVLKLAGVAPTADDAVGGAGVDAEGGEDHRKTKCYQTLQRSAATNSTSWAVIVMIYQRQRKAYSRCRQIGDICDLTALKASFQPISDSRMLLNSKDQTANEDVLMYMLARTSFDETIVQTLELLCKRHCTL